MVLAGVVVGLLLSNLPILLLEDTEPAWYLLGLLAGYPVGLVAHEAAHAAAALALGLRLWSVQLGVGRSWLRAVVVGVRVVLRRWPIAGCVVVEPGAGRLGAARQFLLIAAGPAANAGLLAAAWTGVAGGASDFLSGLGIAQLVFLLGSLWPSARGDGAAPSDGLSLLGLLADRGAGHRAVAATHGCLVRAAELDARGRTAEGLAALAAAPGSGDLLEAQRIALLLKLGRMEEAWAAGRGALAEAEEAPDEAPMVPLARALLLNNTAYAALLTTDRGRLEEADALCREAVAKAPGVPAFRHTRGALDVAAGDTEAGRRGFDLLAAEDEDGEHAADLAAWRAAAAWLEGDAASTADLAAEARLLAPDDPQVEAILRLYAGGTSAADPRLASR